MVAVLLGLGSSSLPSTLTQNRMVVRQTSDLDGSRLRPPDGQPHGRIVAVHNLAEEPTEVTLELAHEPTRLFGDAKFESASGPGTGETAEADGGIDAGEWRFELDRYGYCWVRVEEGM